MTQITLNERHVYRYWVARSPEDGHLFVSNSFKVDPDTSAGGNAVVANAYELSEENRMLKLEIENIRLKTKLDKLRGQSEPLDTLYKHKGQVIVEDIQEDGQHKHRLTFTVEGDNRIRIAHALTDIIGLYQSDLTNVMTSDVK